MSEQVENKNKEITETNDSYHIYIFHGPPMNKWETIAKIDEQKDTISFIGRQTRFSKPELQLLQTHEMRLVTSIMTAERSKLYEEFLENIETSDVKENLQSYLIQALYCRRGTVYIVLQVSKYGNRILCYGTGKVHHSAQCFGTSPIANFSLNELNAGIVQGIDYLKKGKCKKVPLKIVQSIKRNEVIFHC